MLRTIGLPASLVVRQPSDPRRAEAGRMNLIEATAVQRDVLGVVYFHPNDAIHVEHERRIGRRTANDADEIVVVRVQSKESLLAPPGSGKECTCVQTQDGKMKLCLSGTR